MLYSSSELRIFPLLYTQYYYEVINNLFSLCASILLNYKAGTAQYKVYRKIHSIKWGNFTYFDYRQQKFIKNHKV